MPNPFTPATLRLARGGLIGLLATIPMTLAMLAARRSRLLRTPPPQEITKRLLAPIASPRARRPPAPGGGVDRPLRVWRARRRRL